MQAHLRERDLDAALIERTLQAAHVVTFDGPLFQWRDAETRADHHRQIGPLLALVAIVAFRCLYTEATTCET